MKFVRAEMYCNTVKGRIYRTQEGKFYPHPGCFIAPTKLLNADAETFDEFFDGLNEGQFAELTSEIELRQGRPCVLQSTHLTRTGK